MKKAAERNIYNKGILFMCKIFESLSQVLDNVPITNLKIITHSRTHVVMMILSIKKNDGNNRTTIPGENFMHSYEIIGCVSDNNMDLIIMSMIAGRNILGRSFY